MSKHVLTMALVWTAVIYSLPLSAHAYLDPGTGSFVIQAVVASFLGIAFTVKTYWQQLKLKFGQCFGRKNEDSADN